MKHLEMFTLAVAATIVALAVSPGRARDVRLAAATAACPGATWCVQQHIASIDPIAAAP